MSRRQSRMWPVPRCETCGCPLLVWLRPRQVASALQVTTAHVYRLIRRGELEGRDVGLGTDREYQRVSHESVHRWLDESGPDPDWWVEFESLQEGC